MIALLIPAAGELTVVEHDNWWGPAVRGLLGTWSGWAPGQVLSLDGTPGVPEGLVMLIQTDRSPEQAHNPRATALFGDLVEIYGPALVLVNKHPDDQNTVETLGGDDLVALTEFCTRAEVRT